MHIKIKIKKITITKSTYKLRIKIAQATKKKQNNN